MRRMFVSLRRFCVKERLFFLSDVYGHMPEIYMRHISSPCADSLVGKAVAIFFKCCCNFWVSFNTIMLLPIQSLSDVFLIQIPDC
jgi:hypothetical protein